MEVIQRTPFSLRAAQPLKAERNNVWQRSRLRCPSKVHRPSPVPISLTRREVDPDNKPIICTNDMAWRPNDNLIEGELNNQVPGKVTGWIRFFREGKTPLRVTLDLVGDFHEDIRGTQIRLTNSSPSDGSTGSDRMDRTYMDGFSETQRGVVGDMTAGRSLGPWTPALAERFMAQHETAWEALRLSGARRNRMRKAIAHVCRQHIANGDPFYPYVSYPYLEWYAANGRVVLELDSSQVEIVDGADRPRGEKTLDEHVRDERQRVKALCDFMAHLAQQFSGENRQHRGDVSSQDS
jgi:hypothetical protein